jgi:hypothetical protein
LEGEPSWIAEDARRGAVRRLVEDGFTVLHSLDAEDSTAWITRLAKRARRAAPTTRTEGPRRTPRHPSAQAEVMLSVVPGISPTMARSLLATHGSIEAVAAAAPDGLLRHPASVGCALLDWPTRCVARTSHPSTASRSPTGPAAGRDRCGGGSSPGLTAAQNRSRSIVGRSPCAPCVRPLPAPS